jgi:nicotinamidase-related amidase
MSKKSALLIIDVQVNVVKDAYKRDQVLDTIHTLLSHARGSGTPVIYVQHESQEGDGLEAGTRFIRPLCSRSWRSVGLTISSW